MHQVAIKENLHLLHMTETVIAVSAEYASGVQTALVKKGAFMTDSIVRKIGPHIGMMALIMVRKLMSTREGDMV